MFLIMKIRLSILLALAAFAVAQAQDKPFSFTIKAGASLSNTKFVNNGHRLTTLWVPSIFAGVGGGYAISPLLAIEADVLLLTKGHALNNVSVFTGEQIGSNRFGALHLDMPINLKAGLDIGPKLRLYAQVGPYLSLALKGRMWISSEDNSGIVTAMNCYPGNTTEGLDFGGAPHAALRRFDVGLDAGAGVVLASHYQLGLLYYHGLRNQAKPAGDVLKHRMLCLELGYRF